MIGAAQTDGDLAILDWLVLIPVRGSNVAVLWRGCGFIVVVKEWQLC